jgi:hypothetical protein
MLPMDSKSFPYAKPAAWGTYCRLTSWLVLAVATALATVCPSATGAPGGFERVPFHAALIDGKQARLDFDGASRRFRVTASAEWTLPADFIPQAFVRAGAGQLLALGRPALRAELQVLRLTPRGAVERIALDESLARRLHLMHAFAAHGALLAVVYDVEETFASGRSGSVVRDGVDLYRIDVLGSRAQFQRLIDKAPIAGLDNAFRDVSVSGQTLACAQTGCLRVQREPAPGAGLTADVLRPAGWSGHAQVELFVRDGQPRALLRRDEDDRFTPPPVAGETIYKDCPVTADAPCIDLPADRLPVGTDVHGQVRYLSSCADAEALLRHEVARMPNIGLPFWGVNNHEGRIPWGQVYVLDGLLDVASGLALPGPRFDRLRRDAVQRARAEVAYWSRLAASDPPWFWSRRYSLERADLMSVLHLGRMARVAARTLALQDDPVTRGLLASLHREMTSFARSIERLQDNSLRIKKGVPFWFDGGNAPWNYQSGWIDGLAALAGAGLDSGDSAPAAIGMVRDFLATEVEPGRPDRWNYCAGLCQQGWKVADEVSINTPAWEGNRSRTSSAHTSYRSMDARAVLEASASWRMPDVEWFPGYARDLVERGWLYPMIAAPLARFGERPEIAPHLQLRYGRSAMPWEGHNQVWALDAVARALPGCTGSDGKSGASPQSGRAFVPVSR